MKIVKRFVLCCLLLFVCSLCILFTVINSGQMVIIKIRGDSMSPTLFDGDLYFASKVSIDDLRCGDIVVVPDHTGKTELLVKRVAGLPGDEIEFDGGILYINGNEVNRNNTDIGFEDFTLTVPENATYLLGDNPDNSYDSRYFGPYELDEEIDVYKVGWRIL